MRSISTRFVTFALALLFSTLPLAASSPPPPAPSADTSSVPTARRCPASSLELRNDITGLHGRAPRPTPTARFQFFNVPFNPYELHVEVQGFEPVHQPVDVRSAVPLRGHDRARARRRHGDGDGDRRGDGGAARDRHLDVPRRHRQVLHRAGAGHRRLAGHGGADHRHARLRQGRERPLPLPGLPQPGPVRDRRPDDLGPDRRHVLELDRSRHRPVDGGHLRQRPRRVRREGRHRRQPGDEVRPRHAVPRRRLRRRRALLDLRGRPRPSAADRGTSRPSPRSTARGPTASSTRSTSTTCTTRATPSAASCASTTPPTTCGTRCASRRSSAGRTATCRTPSRSRTRARTSR